MGFVAQVTLFAFPMCWLLQFLEKRIVGVRSDFWDAFLASFLSLIGTTAIGAIMSMTLYRLHLIPYDLIYIGLAVLLWVVLLRKLLGLELCHSVKVSILMVLALYGLGWGLWAMGIAI